MELPMNIKEKKQQALNKLYAPYKNSKMSPFSDNIEKKVIFGHGNPNAQLMIIGEAPGKEEEKQGIPFIGRSGKLLTKTLEAAGIARESVFITNVVKCRPPNNRTPSKKEMAHFINLFLNKEIQIIKPSIICTLGASALSAFINEPIKITQIRGEIICHDAFKIIPTFHPAYILRNRKQSSAFLTDFAYIKSLV